MPIDVSPLTANQLITNFASRSKEEVEQLAIQISSGLQHQDYAGFSEDGTLEKLISLDTAIEGIEAFRRTNNTAVARAKTTEQALEQIQDIADEFAKNITNRRNSASGDTVPIDLLGTAALSSMASNLNIKFDDRFLFAGSKTNTRPVQNITSANVSSSTLVTNASYYQGDTNKPTARSNDTENIEYGVLANHQAFQRIIGAIHLAMEGHTGNDDETLSDAMDMINNGISDLVSLRAESSISINRLEEANRILEDTQLLLEDDKKNISQTDIVEATTKMQEGETVLQAVYIALNRISRLSLTNFLN